MSRGSWPRRLDRHFPPRNSLTTSVATDRSAAARAGKEINTPRRGETPRSSIRPVLGHQSHGRIARTRSGISTSPARSPSVCECAARSEGAYAAVDKWIAAACWRSPCDLPGRSTGGSCGIARSRRSGTHATKSPVRWRACWEPAFNLRTSASLPRISAISSSSTNCASLIRARAAVAMKFASGRRSAAAASRNSSYASLSNRDITVLAMFLVSRAESVPLTTARALSPLTQSNRPSAS